MGTYRNNLREIKAEPGPHCEGSEEPLAAELRRSVEDSNMYGVTRHTANAEICVFNR